MLGENNPTKKCEYKKILSDEQRKAISERMKQQGSSSKGTIGINNGVINKRVPKKDVQSYLENGWSLGWAPGTIRPHKQIIQKTGKAVKILVDAIGNDKFHEVRTEVMFRDCAFKKALPFDIGVYKRGSDFKQLISLMEYDGEQHEKPVTFLKLHKGETIYSRFIGIQVRDWIKDKYCLENDIPLVRIKQASSLKSYSDVYQNSRLIGKAQGSDDELFCSVDQPNDFTIGGEKGFVFFLDKKDSKERKRYSINKIISCFQQQKIFNSISFSGKEPLNNIKQLLWFIFKFRKTDVSPVYIYTGYSKFECKDLITLIDFMGWRNVEIRYKNEC